MQNNYSWPPNTLLRWLPTSFDHHFYMIFQSFIVTFIWLEQFQAGENSLELSMIIKMYIH